MRAQFVPFLFAPFLLLLAGCPVWGSDYDGPPGPCAGLGCICDFDSDCVGGLTCESGVCEDTGPECTRDSECFPGEMCVSGSCRDTPMCEDDEDCTGSEECVSGVCREPMGPSACRTHGDCATGLYCDDASELCVDSGTCTDDAACADFGDFYCDFRGTCVPDAPGACRSNADCGSDQCIEGFCREPNDICQFAYECGPGRACVNSGCADVCADDSSCGAGATCQGGFCQPEAECISSSECDTGEHCVEARCLPDCASFESVCDSSTEYCAEDEFCRPDWTRRPFCSNDEDCAEGSVCVDGACRTPCPSGTDTQCRMTDPALSVCAADSLCYSTDETMPECEFASDCTGGASCVNAVCRR